MPTLDNLDLFHALAQIAEALEHVRDECGAGAMYDALDALVLRLDELINAFVEGQLLPEEGDSSDTQAALHEIERGDK
jgi:hypothetical protein